MARASASAASFTVATYNVENYTLADRRTADGYRPNYPKPEVEKAALRRVIRELDADVLLLQEMGGPDFLEELQRDLSAEGMSYPFSAILVRGDEPRHLAALSRRPFREVVRHADLSFSYQARTEFVKRGMLELACDIDGRELRIFAVHLKSRLEDDPADAESAARRAAEARMIAQRLSERRERLGQPAVLVAGDFNAEPGSEPVTTVRVHSPAAPMRLLKASDDAGESWTHTYASRGQKSRVDHILVSETPWLVAALPRGGARIASGAAAAAASDHRPVVLRLELRPGRAGDGQ